MKRSCLLAFSMLVFFTQQLSATVRSVSNYSVISAQHATIQAAIDSASAGDTIMVHGSPNNYDGFTLDKKLVIIGPGGWNHYGANNAVANIIGNSYLNSGASQSVIVGLTGSTQISWSSALPADSILFKRCVFGNMGISMARGWNFSQCCFYSVGLSYENSPLVGTPSTFANCLFLDWTNISNVSSVLRVTVKNCLIGTYGEFLTASVARAEVRNSIVASGLPTSNTGIAYYFNDFYWTAPLPSVALGVISVGNMNVEPQFVGGDYFNYGAEIWSRNCRLSPSSPLIGAGSDGTDIGLTGGNNSLYANDYPENTSLVSPFPQIYELSTPNPTVPVGGTLNVQVKARKRN